MSKHKSTTKKVTLDEMSSHQINNKRQAMKDIKMLDFNTQNIKIPLRKDFIMQYLLKI